MFARFYCTEGILFSPSQTRHRFLVSFPCAEALPFLIVRDQITCPTFFALLASNLAVSLVTIATTVVSTSTTVSYVNRYMDAAIMGEGRRSFYRLTYVVSRLQSPSIDHVIDVHLGS